MSSFQLEDPVREAFQSATASKNPPDVRTLLVQTTASGNFLGLSGTLSASQTDREDFQPQLTTVFGQEPNRSGYALYRLDSQAANGDWEWLCIAYQPEGAKVKEKMQYVKTRTALLAVLNEQHFIETLYATSSSDFHFPAKLRNARKHDYQNPQLKTAGKPASEAAGTDAGGAKRNFGQFVSKSAASNSATETYHSLGQTAPSATPAPAPVNARVADPPAKTSNSNAEAADSVPVPQSTAVTAQDQQQQPIPTHSSLGPGHDSAAVELISAAATREGAPLGQVANTAASSSKLIETEQAKVMAQQKQDDEEAGPIAPSAQAHLPAVNASSEVLTQARSEGDSEMIPVAPKDQDQGVSHIDPCHFITANVDEQAQTESKAPEEPPSRATLDSEAAQDLSQPQVPSSELAKQQLHDDTIPVSKAKSQAELEELACQSKTSASLPSAGASPSPIVSSPLLQAESQGSQGCRTGQSDHGGQSGIDGSGGKGSGGKGSGAPSNHKSPKPYEWTNEAETALSGLADLAFGSSGHNFVALSLAEPAASSHHQVKLASPPHFLPPRDLQAELKSVVSECADSTFAFYRYPSEAEDKQIVFMYAAAPRGASSAQQTVYANSLEPVRLKAADLTSLHVEREGVDALYGPYPRPLPGQAEDVSSRIESVKYRVEEASKAAGRSQIPRLVAVSKLHPPSSILAAYIHAKQTHFGENYVQEMVDKAKVLPRDIRWHFVGGMQSNKGKMLASVPNLYLLETLDSIKAANVLEKALASPDAIERDEPLRVYLQVNTSGEDVKSGLPPLTQEAGGTEDGEGHSLLELVKHVVISCPNLVFSGLMTIGSAANSSAGAAATNRDEALRANPDFAKLHESRRRLVQMLRSIDLDKSSYSELLAENGAEDGGLELSMGMTADFPVAIAAGSDNVRIGTDCFGVRPGTREEAKKAMEGEINMDIGAANPLLGEKGFAKPKRPGGRK